MFHINGRELQLARLRADRHHDLASERVTVDFVVVNDILLVAADRLFNHLRQYLGRYRLIADLIGKLTAVAYSMLSVFVVMSAALETKSGNGIFFNEFDLSLNVLDQTSLISRIYRICGALRDRQPLWVKGMTCDNRATVDPLMGNELKATEARSWHLTI